MGGGEQLKRLLRCPADSFDGRKTRPGVAAGQGPYLYSYHMNSQTAINFYPYGFYRSISKISQWRVPAKKILPTEGREDGGFSGLGQPVIGYTSPLSKRHGSAMFHGDIPGHLSLLYGTRLGSNVSTVFMDGHVEGIDQDFAFDESRWLANAR